ncbi:hypothetical protein AURDEDRAFT_152478 [Auricularia subglabra TFB-10046 SS5]|nr:hypothetical protein AURDEDRAFT_152478 [Auricularia subglabra TFB-10046 SS5]
MPGGTELTAARQSFAAAIVACVGYGLYVVLAGISIHFLLQRKVRARGQWVLLCYTVTMLLVSIVYFVCGCKWSEVEFVEGVASPAEFASLLSSSVLSVTKNTATVVNIFLADSLILYRTWIIWNRNHLCMLVPCIVYLGSIASGIGLSVAAARPAATFGQHAVVAFGTSFWSISVFLNVLTTAMIAGRLLYHRRQMEMLGRARHSQYISVIAVLVESAALYSLSGLVYIPLFALNLPQQYAFSALLCNVTLIAPNLIVLRMALGYAVKDDYTSEMHIVSSSGSTAVPSRPSRQRNDSWSYDKEEYKLASPRPSHTVQVHIDRVEYLSEANEDYHHRERHLP